MRSVDQRQLCDLELFPFRRKSSVLDSVAVMHRLFPVTNNHIVASSAQAFSSLSGILGLLAGIFDIIIHVAVVLIPTYFIAKYVSRQLRRGFTRVELQPSVIILTTRAVAALIWAVGVLYALAKAGFGFTPVSAFIGVVGLAASLSLQTVLQNLVAGIYMLTERPFAIGDTILVVGGNGLNHEGTVEDIQMRTTHLRSRESELILVPNAALFSAVVTNRTAVGGYAKSIRVTFPRTIEPGSASAQIVPLLEAIPTVKSAPPPELRVDAIGKERWTGCLSFWADRLDADSDAAWAIAGAFPEVTVNEAVPA